MDVKYFTELPYTGEFNDAIAEIETKIMHEALSLLDRATYNLEPNSTLREKIREFLADAGWRK